MKLSDIYNAVGTIILIIVLTWVMYNLFGGDTIFCADASQDAVFYIDLQKDTKYELWVLDMNGPDTVKISIKKDSYIPYGDTFRLMHPEGDYLPYHPAFWVKENGTYQIIVHPLDPGTIRIKVQQGASF